MNEVLFLLLVVFGEWPKGADRDQVELRELVSNPDVSVLVCLPASRIETIPGRGFYRNLEGQGLTNQLSTTETFHRR